MSPKTKDQQAKTSFCNGQTCAQSILTTYSKEYKLDPIQALKLTTGLAGGMGRMAQTCGAVTGSILVLGLAKGTSDVGDNKTYEATMCAVQDFSKQFAEKHGSLLCKDLLDCDISQPKGYQRARKEELFKRRCPNFVETAVEILDEIIDR